MKLKQIKQKFTQALCVGLSALMMISSVPIQSFATGTQGAGAGSGGTGGFTMAGNGASYFTSSQQGYRFSVVDMNGNVVSKINGAPGVLDILFYAPPTTPDYFVSSYFDQNLQVGSKDAKPGYQRLDIEEALKYIKYEAEANNATFDLDRHSMIPWMTLDGTRILQGTQFKNWMIGDGSGQIYDYTKPVTNTSGGTGSSSGSGGTSRPSTGGTGSSSGGTSTSTVSSSTYTSLYRIINSAFTSEIPVWDEIASHPIISYRNTVVTQVINFGKQQKLQLEYYKSTGQLTDIHYDILVRLVDTKTNTYTEKYSQIVGMASLDFKNMLAKAFDSLTGSFTSYAAPPEQSTYTGESGWAAYLLNMNDGEKWIIDLDGTTAPGSQNTIRPLDVLQANNYTIVVEPILWGRIQDFDGRYSPNYIYGTLRDWVKYSSRNFGGFTARKRGFLTQRWHNTLLPNAMYIDEFDKDGRVEALGLKPATGIGNNNVQIGFDVLAQKMDAKEGVGLHLYWKTTSSQTKTWDEVNYPAGEKYKPAPAPDPTNLPEESELVPEGRSKEIKIVKYYQNSFDNGKTYIDFVYYGRENNPRTIKIQSEETYVLTDWYTSTKVESYPPNGTPVSNWSYYDIKSRYNDGGQEGTKEKTITIPNDSNEKVLHILLRYKEPTIGDVKVVKVFETAGVVDDVTIEDFGGDPYNIQDPIEDYRYVEGKTSDEDLPPTVDDWGDSKGESIPGRTVPIPLELKVIYLRYVRDNPEDHTSGLLIHENELSHNFSLIEVCGSLFDTTRRYGSVSVPRCPHSVFVGYKECSACRKGDYSNCKGGSCGNPKYDDCNVQMDLVNEGDYQFTVKNHYSYNKEFVYNWKQTSDKTISGANENGTGSFEKVNTPDGEFTLSRAIDDKPTLYPNKNSSLRSLLMDMGFTHESYIPAGDRYGSVKNQATRKIWRDTFETDWRNKNNQSPVLDFEHATHSESASRTKSTSEYGIDTMNDAYSEPNNTTIYGFWGKENKGIDAPEDRAVHFKVDGVNERVQTLLATKLDKSKKVTYYPYYKMVVETLSQREKDVYLTSENLSTMLSVSRADVSVAQEKGGVPLELSSYQWSIHAKAQAFLDMFGINDRDSLLPAGAIYQLKVKDGEGVWIKGRTYQVCVADEDYNKLASTTGVKKLSEAKQKAKDFRDDMKELLDGYEVVLKVKENIVEERDIKNEGIQITGLAKQDRFDNRPLSTDDKYQLDAKRFADGSANRSDLDILNSKNYEIEWKLESDANGKITIYKNGTKAAEISKTQSVSKLLSNSAIKELDDRTKAVTNFVKSVDRNMGSDRSGDTWYNEGFTMYVYENDFAYKVGFGASNPIRSAALNVNVNGVLDNRDDMFNADPDKADEKARTLQFRTSTQSTSDLGRGKGAGYVGTFDGMDIILPNIDDLFTTKLFYTSNTTVHDNN